MENLLENKQEISEKTKKEPRENSFEKQTISMNTFESHLHFSKLVHFFNVCLRDFLWRYYKESYSYLIRMSIWREDSSSLQ